MTEHWNTSGKLGSQRRVTARGVLWLGLKCDVRCKFCYDELMPAAKKAWISVDEAKQALLKFKNFYGNEHVDFMGGEPTLHPEILGILETCREIGIRPTVITHAMHLSDERRLIAFKEAGVFDFLVSIHGIGSTVREIHAAGRDNFERQVSALENMRKHEIPFRFNCTMINDNIDQLPEIALLARDYGARVVNFLTFNPYFEWSRKSEIEFQARHTDIAPRLMEAIDICEGSGVEANVRYMPICCLPGYEKNVFTGYQLPYDEHEWDYNSWYDMDSPPSGDPNWYWNASRKQQERHNYSHVAACSECSVRAICDGFHDQYTERYGDSEARPIPISTATKELRPDYFVSRQKKWTYDDSPAAYRKKPTNADRAPLTATQFSDKVDHRAGVKKA